MQSAIRAPLKSKLATLLVLALASVPALAQTAQPQPDVADVAAYLLAGIATLAIVGNAKLIVRGAMAVFRWVGSMVK